MTPISVIVPTFNRAALVSEAVESLLQQSAPPAQIIVADDGSSDDTAQVLGQFGDRIEYSRQENAGKAVTLNRAMSRVRHELVWIFDDDDVAAPLTAQQLSVALSTTPAAGFSYGDYDYLVETRGGWSTRSLDLPRPSPGELKLAILERCFIFQPGMLVRRSCYEAVGPFNEILTRSEDYEMLLRLSRRFEGVRVNGVVFHQRQHAGVRGPVGAQVSGADRFHRWADEDAQVFRTIRSSYALAEFVPGASQGDSLTADQTLQALLNRCVVMARKGLWDLAGEDLAACAPLLREQGLDAFRSQDLTGFARVFGSHSYALLKFSAAASFFDALLQLPGESQAQVRGALLRPLPGRFWYAAKQTNRVRIAELWQVCQQLATPPAFLSLVQALIGRAPVNAR